jgi:hypothetical protein
MSQEQFSSRPVWKAFSEVGNKVDAFFSPEPVQPKSFMSKFFGANKQG